MIKAKYQLGVMDIYPIAVNKTKIENNLGIHFETVDVLTYEQANLRLTI